MGRGGTAKWWTAAAVTGGVVLADALTKSWIQAALALGDSVPVLGDTVRLTYVLNPGAAFGLHVGPWSRQVFTALALVALVVIGLLLRATPGEERSRVAALALVAGGALGNLLDRVVGPGGVVDFLDVGFGALRWPIFNLADVGVTTGAFLLVVLLWDEDRPDAPPEADAVPEPRADAAPS